MEDEARKARLMFERCCDPWERMLVPFGAHARTLWRTCSGAMEGILLQHVSAAGAVLNTCWDRLRCASQMCER